MGQRRNVLEAIARGILKAWENTMKKSLEALMTSDTPLLTQYIRDVDGT
jgi:hypothetical protein